MHPAIRRIILRCLPIGHDVDILSRFLSDGVPVESIARKGGDVSGVGAGEFELGGMVNVFVDDGGDGLRIADGEPVELPRRS